MGPKNSNNAEQSATTIEVSGNENFPVNTTTLSDNSQGDNCDEQKLENTNTNEIDKSVPASYPQDVNDVLITQEENPILNQDSTDCIPR